MRGGFRFDLARAAARWSRVLAPLVGVKGAAGPWRELRELLAPCLELREHQVS